RCEQALRGLGRAAAGARDVARRALGAALELEARVGLAQLDVGGGAPKLTRADLPKGMAEALAREPLLALEAACADADARATAMWSTSGAASRTSRSARSSPGASSTSAPRSG